MKILVCITHVPETTTKIKFKDGKLDSTGVNFVVGPYDDFALSKAIDLQKELKAKVTVLNVGGAESENTIRKALALGADDAIRVNAEPTDSYFVAEQIAAIAQKEQYDLILMGRESSDFNGGQVHGMVAEMLGIPAVVPCMTMTFEGSMATMTREIEGGKEIITCALPFVAGCQEPIAEWKIANMQGIMQARRKPLAVVEPTSQNMLTQVVGYDMPAERSGCKMVPASDVKELVRLLKEEAKVI